MDIESINKQIQAENDSYHRDKDRLQQELFNLKQRHERRISGLKAQKEQIKDLNTNENHFKSVIDELNKFI